MIDDNTKRLARTALYARARAIRSVRFGDPVQRVFTLEDIRRGTPDAALAPWLNERLGDQGNVPMLYSLTVNEVEVATALRRAFVQARNVQPRECALPRDNAGHPIGTTLYVGRSQNIRSRLRQHLWQAPPQTYALNIHRWCPDIAGAVTVSVQPVLGHVDNDTVQDLEDTLWKTLRPIFGRSGSR